MRYEDGNGRSFELPKLTLALDERMSEAASSGKTRREKAEAHLALMSEALGADYVAERCGGSEVDEVDLSELSRLFSEVTAAYRAPEIEDVAKQLGGLADIVGQIEKLAEQQKRVEALANSRQGFNRVV